MAENRFLSFIEKLSNKLKDPLPGEAAHQMMEASSAAYLGIRPGKHTRNSAVLMLFYPANKSICFSLILRNSYNGVHSGQIAFPGGRYEVSDRNLIHTALRETQEEIGINIDDIKILGLLTELYIAPSDFLVLPVLGYLTYKPEFLPDPREVKTVFDANLDCFAKPDSVGCSEVLIPGDRITTPHYVIDGNKIWGATAKIIRELLSVMGHDLLFTKSR